ncbi:hypothetical protein VTG60DRAFT_3803 [Thermothelomyces hinnuleus]
MVYCGKASLGCQSCRTRRIKCDKVQPQCTQCVRIRKQCPGYRDQLSLMFRDESTKVMQKAHAQWGVSEASPGRDLPGSPPTSASSSTQNRSRSSAPGSGASPLTTVATKSQKTPAAKRFPKEIDGTPADKAIHFYIEHYVVGLPDEPRAIHELQGVRWVHSRETRDIMAAVGLAGMSNLSGDKELNTLAKHHYGLALQNMASYVRDLGNLDIDIVLRIVVMMAMYELIRSRRNEPSSPARTHVMGGAAILSTSLNLVPSDGPRGLLQLCFSMIASKQGSFQYSSLEPNVLIPTHIEPSCEEALPEPFFDWISIISETVSESDRPSVELLTTIARFVRLSVLVRSQPLIDGHPKTASIIHEALEINQALDSWQARRDGIWAVVEEHISDFFPSEAVLDGCYHVYDNTHIARIWNHYRWAHLMTNQMLLESVERFPKSSAPLVSAGQQQRSLDCIRRLARDILVSVPTHYRHPTLQPIHWDCFDKTKRGAIIGLAGIPTLLFEVKVAGSAPGIPDRYRAWALDMLEVAYRATGMFQAKTLAGILRKVVERMPSRSLSPASITGGALS